MTRNQMCCCEKCQFYWTCETKWYRGERAEENVCCPTCNYYAICVEKLSKANKLNVEKQK